MSKLKILLLTIYNYPHPGGIASHISTLKNGLEKLKIKSEIFSANSLPLFFYLLIRIIYFFRKLNRIIFYTYYLFFLKFIFEISLFIKYLKRKWNLINVQDPLALNCTKLIQFFYKPKIVLTLHGFLSAETIIDLGFKNDFIQNLLIKEEKQAFKKANKIITIEKSRKKHILKLIKEPKKIVLQKNFVNTSLFHKFKANYFNDKYSLSNKSKIILFPKRIVNESGINYFIEAALNILKKSDDFYFIILGKGYLLKKIKKMVKNNKNILFHKPISNYKMPYIYNSVDVVVIPSISIGSAKEGSSMSILEAMACGTPIITTPVGGNVELIESEKTGILIPEKNSNAISNAIMRLCQDRDLWIKISKNSREFALKNLSYIEAAKNFLRFYLLS
ncbi:MAG: glycosyltransferase family 4 protein [Candidatus Helarchaeota archaeon]